MSRLNPVNPEHADAKTNELFEQVKRKLGKVPNLMLTLGHSPAALGGYLSLNGSLAGGELNAKERELVALVTAEHNGCDYCLAAHSTIGNMVGLTPDQIEGARRAALSDPKLNAFVNFVKQVLKTAGHINDATLEEFRSAGYSDGAVAEAVALIGESVLTNYFNNVAQTVVDFPKAKPLAA
ncbi:carboxymuconolactone decarboxylase family protein [Calycomorphotria hydatis]|uniref:Carboxymuconolactone decarboxylase family protein n=1 Tax=Calycomorphotria hydatis TaxID=2528027 RepID=A0A517TCU9_9PLAN|nr:carboxymuconolactone decarboxylase family protein [Calycomorphotria hydatis]QDT66194.1 Carboxymuconolactone decarboxylase family protein [Calycomorphotria hydatis]